MEQIHTWKILRTVFGKDKSLINIGNIYCLHIYSFFCFFSDNFLFIKIRDAKGTFYAKMGSVKDRNGMNLTEAEDIRSGKNTQKNYTKKIFMTQIITMVWLLT